MKKIIAFILSMCLVLCPLTACSKTDDGKYRIALIPMSSQDQHWIFMLNEARVAAEECGCTVTFMAPRILDDAGQIELLNNAVAAQYDAILFAAYSPEASVAALREATEAGIEIIYVDSAPNYEGRVTYATDGFKAGQECGQNMLRILGENGITSGKIGVVSVNTALVNCEARVLGFCDIFKDTDFEILPIQYSNGDVAISQGFAENYITQGVVGIFGSNEGCSIGIGNAIKASGEDMIGFGFDRSDALLSLVEEGYLKGIAVQKPGEMGYKAVKAAVAILDGDTSYHGESYDTGVDIILH